MAKPVTNPVWATDTNFSSGPKAGSPTKVEPSTGAKQQGDVPGQQYRGERHNWWMNLVYQWILYLAGLASDSEFLNETFVWTGSHRWNGALLFTNDATYVTPKITVKYLDLSQGVINADSKGVFVESTGWSFVDPTGEVNVPLELPSGAVITGVEGNGSNDGTPGTIVIRLQRVTPNPTAGAANTVGSPVDILNNSGSTNVLLGNLALTAAVDNTASRLILKLMAGTGDGASGRGSMRWVRITYTESRATGSSR